MSLMNSYNEFNVYLSLVGCLQQYKQFNSYHTIHI
jgi:hypothetical protein